MSEWLVIALIVALTFVVSILIVEPGFVRFLFSRSKRTPPTEDK